jgi:hypothetical protein
VVNGGDSKYFVFLLSKKVEILPQIRIENVLKRTQPLINNEDKKAKDDNVMEIDELLKE